VTRAGLTAKDRKFRIDERPREKEFGVLDRLTWVGIEAQFPEQAEFRRLPGKFDHRPPGGFGFLAREIAAEAPGLMAQTTTADSVMKDEVEAT
jgi:hypothetical protein